MYVCFYQSIFFSNHEYFEELWVLRMAVLNSVVDPWVYIVLRRESLIRISGLYQAVVPEYKKATKKLKKVKQKGLSTV
jgi:hypothetical protein